MFFDIYTHLKLGKAFQAHSRHVWLGFACHPGQCRAKSNWQLLETETGKRPQGGLFENWIVFKIYGRWGGCVEKMWLI